MMPTPNDKRLEQAALYALGALGGRELQAFEKNVAEGCAVGQAVEGFQEVVEQLAMAAKPIAPRADLRAKLFERIKNEGEPSSSKTALVPQPSQAPSIGLTFRRAGGGRLAGSDLRPKTENLMFHQAQDRMTALARIDAGCHYPTHCHDKPEVLYVLVGTCYCGDRLLFSGDYHRVEADMTHEEISTPGDCLMLLMFSPFNEMVDSVTA